MTAKTTTSVTISRDDKTYTIPLNKLSEEDQQWVKMNSVHSRATLKVSIVESRGDTGDYGGRSGGVGADSKKLSIEVTNTGDESFTVEVGWIGQGREKKDYGLYRIIRLKFKADGKQVAECTFPKYGPDVFNEEYKGHYVVLKDSEGKILQQIASQVPFLRFIGKEPENKN